MSRKANLRAIRRLQDAEYDYACWIQENEKATKEDLINTPLFSIVLFESVATEEQKKRCLLSIKKQKYKNIQLIRISDENTPMQDICAQINGEYVLFTCMTDFFAPNAFSVFAKEVEKHPEAQWIYADEDVYRESDGQRILPKFKPEWSYETFMSFFYTGNAACYKTECCKQIGAFNITITQFCGYDFALHFLEICNQKNIYHVSKILYHASDVSLSEDVQRVKRLTAKEAKEAYLERQNIYAELELEKRTNEYRVVYHGTGKVSIVIPSKDNVQMLQKCITTIEQNTEYTDYEIVVVDNGSRKENKAALSEWLAKRNVTYIFEPMNFNFSQMCNIGANVSNGEYILFLNDDIECIDGKWLGRMVGQAAQSGVGAVGAKLLYPEGNKIQHVGVVNLNMGPSHILSKQADEEVLAQARNCLDYNYEAVTAACLLVKRSIYKCVGGFDETFPIACNDVDFCYRLREQGFRNVVRTDAVLIHHESISRGLDAQNEEKMMRLAEEKARLYKAHPWILEFGDRAYNCNCTLDETDFSLADQLNRCKYNRQVFGKPCTNASFCVTIDRMEKQDGLYVKGWYWYGNDEYTNLSDVYLVFQRENAKEVIWYNTCKQVRKDVRQALENEAVYCGFECRIPETKLEKLHGCKVGVCAKMYDLKRNPLTWTEVVLG